MDAAGAATFAAIARAITRVTGSACAASPEQRVAGGHGQGCYRWHAGGGPIFVKVAARGAGAAFEAEALGLAELARAGALRVPRVLTSGSTDAAAFLALEWIEAQAPTAACERRLGEGLAAQHAVRASRYGFSRDNTIGPTPQANGWSESWVEFFRERRLRPQLARAAQRGFAGLLATVGERLLEALPALLAGHAPAPSLLHGDLWGGNWLAAAGGEPVVFDPAVYYGDCEADLAMTRLFGGFGPTFYRAYESLRPPAAGAQLRSQLYNLYHVINHANLFGGGYAYQARALIDELLAEVRG
jgi:protein-ribulosamine 3-kinase